MLFKIIHGHHSEIWLQETTDIVLLYGAKHISISRTVYARITSAAETDKTVDWCVNVDHITKHFTDE